MSDVLALSQLPLFPLHTVLYPGGSLQLQIFEVRYLDLMGKCHKTGAPFGVVSLTQGREVRQRDTRSPGGEGFAPETFADVGTLAHIAEITTLQAGLLRVRCTAGQRFRIQQRSQLAHGLWVANVESVPADLATPIPDDLQRVADALRQVLEREQLHGGEPAVDVSQPYLFQDCGWVANRWCELLQLPAALKQSLMQLDNPLVRLELVGDFLYRAGISG